MQSKLSSFIEAWNNTGVGFFISWAMWVLIVPIFNISTSVNESFIITCMFTITSNARQYLLRRFHNWLDHSDAGKILKANIHMFVVDVLNLTPRQATGAFCATIIFIILGAQYV